MSSFHHQHQIYRAPKLYNRNCSDVNNNDSVSVLQSKDVTAYYQHLINYQQSKNKKIVEFEQQQLRWQKELMRKLQVKSEIQKDTVLKLEEEFRKDLLWKEYIKALINLANNTKCISLQSYILGIYNNDKIHGIIMEERKLILEEFIDTIASRKLIIGIEDLKYISKSIKESGVNIQFSIKKLQKLLDDCGKLFQDILNNISSYQQHHSQMIGNPSICYQLLDTLQQVLQKPLISTIEVDQHEKVELLKEYILELNMQLEDISKKKQLELMTDSFNNQLLAMFPYFSQEHKSSKWFANLKQTNKDIQFAKDDLNQQLHTVLNSLKYQTLRQVSISKDNPSPSISQQQHTTSSSIPLSVVDTILVNIEELLKAVIKEGSKAFLKVFLCISEHILNEVRQVTSLVDVLMYATIVCGIFRSLSPDMHEQSSKIFSHMLLASCSLCTPNLLIADIQVITSELEVRIAMFYAALLSQSSPQPIFSQSLSSSSSSSSQHTVKVSPLTIGNGWTYFHRILVQLHSLIYFHSHPNEIIELSKGGEGNISNATNQQSYSKRIIVACKVIRTFLRIAGYNLFMSYQDKFVDLLKFCQSIILSNNTKSTINTTTTVLDGLDDYHKTDDVRKLLVFLDESIQQRFIVPLYYRNQTPIMLDAAYLTRYAASEKVVVSFLEQDKASTTMQQVKQLGLDRLRSIFNKLSVTKESQQSAIQSLLEKIIISSKASTELLKYTLFKISSNIISDCQEEFFDAMDEGHPMKIAIVTCALCSQINGLANLVKAQFYKHCPLTIPKVAEAGLTGQEFLTDMGFHTNEDRSHWLDRMSKMLCTFSVILLQPQQSVWTIADGWSWLSNIVNTHCSHNNNNNNSIQAPSNNNIPNNITKKLPFYVATALEVVLRVISLQLYQTYGEKFISILVIIRDNILPNFASDTPHKDGLEEYLQRFINSKGNDFMILFNKRCMI